MPLQKTPPPWSHEAANRQTLADMREKACRALTLMGYGETQVKRALGRVSVHVETTLEALMRECLRELGS